MDKHIRKMGDKANKAGILEKRIQELEKENKLLREKILGTVKEDTVSVPKELKPVFDAAQKTVGKYFEKLMTDPARGTIEIGDQRYILVRASALSYDFLSTIKNLYADRGEEKAILFGKNLLFDIAHTIGMNDARNFHSKMGLTDPISKLSAGPVHFAYSGWAFVEILPESAPSPDENYFLTYNHPFSFEADSWIKAKKKSDFPVCIMNAGYSSGWCEESYDIPLTAVEITCKAKGDDNCTFIMAPPAKIEEHIKKYLKKIPSGVRKKIVYDIPTFFERKKVEEALRVSEERYRNLIETMNEGVVQVDNEDKIVFVSKRFCEMFGSSKDELIGKYAYKQLLTQYGVTEKEIKKIIVLRKKGISSQYETQIFTKSGELKWFLIDGSPVYDTNGKVVGSIGVHMDITERKEAEKQLINTQKYLRRIIDSSLDMICASDLEGKITEFNIAAQNTFGYSADEVIGKHVSILYEKFDAHKSVRNQLLNKDGTFSGEIKNKYKNGDVFTSYLSASVIKDESGNAIGIMGVSRDITKIKKDEEKYRAIYDHANVGICQISLDGKFINVNQQFCNIMGYSEEELYKMKFMDLTHPDDAKKSIKFKSTLLKGKYSRNSIEKKYIHKNGSIIYANLTATLVRNQNGDPDYFVSVTEDVTEKKKAEELLKRSLQEKEILLKEIHHRVKNNLQIISSILSLQSSYLIDKRTINILKESQDRIKSMAFIHESLYQTKDFSSINISEYIENLSKNLVYSFGTESSFVSLKLDTDNIDLNLDTAIPCGLIINELVSNSLKYAFPDNHKGEIKITLKQKNKRLILTIADNGVGLPSGLNFKKTESLGLQLVNTLVEQVNGNITKMNVKGTKFIITLAA